MEMTLRWYGTGFDTGHFKKEIRQIPGVTGVITTLYDTKPGEVWSRERIRALKQEVEAAGLHISGSRASMSMTPLKQGRQTGMCISAATERHWKTWARRTFIWCATTLCQCLTGPGNASWPGCALMGLRCWPTPRRRWAGRTWQTMFLDCRGYERHGPAGLGAGAHGPGKGAVSPCTGA